MTGCAALRQLCLAGLLIAAPLLAAAQEQPAANNAPYWPSEREERLAEIEPRMSDILRRSATADYLGQYDEKAELIRQLEELRAEAERLRELPMSTSAAPEQDHPDRQ